MIVDPDFPDHWKTRMLVGLLDGDEAAPVYVLRLWAHCQNRRQATFENINPEALKALCRFPGHSNKLESSLATSGFIRRSGDVLEVVNWADYNASLIAAWNNGKKGGGKSRNKSDVPTYKRTSDPMTSTQWAEVRRVVIDRDGLICRYCKCELLDALIDHIIPPENGGTNDVDNLCVSCRPCNTAKARGSTRGTMSRGDGRREEKRRPLAVPLAIPSPLDTPEFRSAWQLWILHRREIGHPLKPTQESQQFKLLENLGPARACELIEHTISMGWRGLRDKDGKDLHDISTKVASGESRLPSLEEERKHWVP